MKIKEQQNNKNLFPILNGYGEARTNTQRDSIIIKTLEQFFPNSVDKKIYHFPYNYSYILTDNNEFFSISRTYRSPDNSQVVKIFNEKFSELIISEFMGMDSTEELKTVLNALEEEKQEEKYLEYRLTPRNMNKQLDIYLSQNNVSRIEKLGYKVHRRINERTVEQWNKEQCNYEKITINESHYFIKLTEKVFINSCRSGILMEKGKTQDQNGVVQEVNRGRSKGCNNDYLSKGIVLYDTCSQVEYRFKSRAELAKEFGIDKRNLSRKLKGKKNGDIVKFNGVKYQLK